MATWNGRTVLVTGAEGFIGSTLVALLRDEGADVRASAHYKPYAEQGNLAGLDVEVLAGDIRDASRVTDAVAGCEVVFHLAALQPQSPYSASKIAADMMALSWYAFELPVSVVRRFNT